jgi:hypothetical protein
MSGLRPCWPFGRTATRPESGHPAGQPTWKFSSFTKCVMLGMYPIDWAIEEAEVADAGEGL